MNEAFTRRYRLLERLAIGGTAEVFRAVFVGPQGGGEKPVVIKRVLPQLARDERFRVLFFEEACLAATLTHPNVVQVLDYGNLGDTCFIAMEPIEGQDLETLLAAARVESPRKPVPAALAALIAVNVGEALQFIHQHTSSEGLPLRIIHRDVSPHNILVSYQGDVKLTDFGIAKSVIRREHTVDGTIRGKLDYMAPEQALPDQQVDHRADLFALGCVLYEMLHGAPPLRGSSEIDTLERVRDLRMDVPPGELDAPLALRQVLDRLLRADPAERYPQARELVAALKGYLDTCTHQPTRADLGRWASSLRGRELSGTDDHAVDDAVRALLGDPLSDAPEVRPRQGSPVRALSTSVFARSSEPGNALDAGYSSGRYSAAQLHAAARDAEYDPTSISVETTAQSRVYPERPRSPWRLVAPVAAFGLIGWLLWGIERLGEDPVSASARGHREAVTATPSATDDASQTTTARRTQRSRKARRARSRRKTSAAEGRTRGASARRETGYLTLNSLPWSRVYLDGYYVGNTPLIRHEVRAGKRRVQLRGPDGMLRKAFSAAVERGQTGKFTFDFRQPSRTGAE